MALWDGSLKNSQTDIVIDSVIISVMALACYLQISRILSVGSTHGISVYFLLFNALSCNHQFANTFLLLAHAWQTEKSPFWRLIGRDELRPAQALGAVLGIAQVALHWACSLMLLPVSPWYPKNVSESSDVFTNPYVIPVVFMLHYHLFLFTAFALTQLKIERSPLNTMGIDILIDISVFVNTRMSPVFVILQFYPQIIEFHLMYGSPGSLSLPSLGLRAVVMLAIAGRGFQRLGPPICGEGARRVPMRLWYQWCWLPFSWMIEGIGCALLMGMYLRAGWMGAALNIAGEKTPVVS